MSEALHAFGDKWFGFICEKIFDYGGLLTP